MIINFKMFHTYGYRLFVEMPNNLLKCVALYCVQHFQSTHTHVNTRKKKVKALHPYITKFVSPHPPSLEDISLHWMWASEWNCWSCRQFCKTPNHVIQMLTWNPQTIHPHCQWWHFAKSRQVNCDISAMDTRYVFSSLNIAVMMHLVPKVCNGHHTHHIIYILV